MSISGLRGNPAIIAPSPLPPLTTAVVAKPTFIQNHAKTGPSQADSVQGGRSAQARLLAQIKQAGDKADLNEIVSSNGQVEGGSIAARVANTASLLSTTTAVVALGVGAVGVASTPFTLGVGPAAGLTVGGVLGAVSAATAAVAAVAGTVDTHLPRSKSSSDEPLETSPRNGEQAAQKNL